MSDLIQIELTKEEVMEIRDCMECIEIEFGGSDEVFYDIYTKLENIIK